MLSCLQQQSPFYKQLFSTHTINIDAIKSLADLQQVPVTTKEDLQ